MIPTLWKEETLLRTRITVAFENTDGVPYRFCHPAGLEGDEEEDEAGLHNDEELPCRLQVMERRSDAHTICHQIQLQAQCYHLEKKP
ncbi:hypothetical protein E2C01_008240 [Portunus trituberculatus]|uniref:Uncharacterized protein n=1 Tax=Portunus trituberculatus TaxID=210409 RepID=A0A5B7D1T9_PORTR|nr:hypothetical protein [Portunus trituberculatus]